MLKKILFLVLVTCSFSAAAQTNAVEAKAAYMLAEESYDKADYQSALKFLQITKHHLGAVNSKILYLETQAYAELYKTDKAYSPQLIKSIESFQAAPDIESFNEDKVLEIVKLKITIADQVEREAAITRAKLEKEQGIAKRISDYHYPNWPFGITIDELKVLNPDSLLFKGSLKKDFYKSTGVTKYYQTGLSFNKLYPVIPENYTANNVMAAMTSKDSRIIAYQRVLYQKRTKGNNSLLEVSRAEILNLIAKQSALLGQEAQKTDKFLATTTNSYFWFHGNKAIYWHVVLLTVPPYYCTIVEEIVQR